VKREFELKAALPGGATGLRERLADAGWSLSFEGRMSDRRFDTPGRSLESRDEVLRIRCMTPVLGESRTLLGWKGQASEEHGYKVRPELETVVQDTETAVAILENLGYSEVIFAIERCSPISVCPERIGSHGRSRSSFAGTRSGQARRLVSPARSPVALPRGRSSASRSPATGRR
jgi:hypothetical protein